MKIQDLMETFYITEIHNVNFLTQVFKKLFVHHNSHLISSGYNYTYNVVTRLSADQSSYTLYDICNLQQITASEVTTLWRYRNECIIIIILLQHRVYLTVRLQKNRIAILTVKASGQQTTKKLSKSWEPSAIVDS